VTALPSHADSASDSTLQPALRECVARAVRRYLADMDEKMPDGVYELVLQEVECALFSEVLKWADGNRSTAAAALGINRATLRKKLSLRGLD
jgi:Fis family transcriptional regulator, factor for inversion stimulation protein